MSVLLANAASAQVITTGEPVPLVEIDGIEVARGVWSPDESAPSIAFTTEDLRGLWVKRIDTGEVTALSDEASAGFGFEWSPAGNAIVARVSRFDRRRRLDSIKIFGLADGSEHQVTEFGKALRSVPRWSGDGTAILMLADGELRRHATPAAPAKTVSGAVYPRTLYADNQIRVDRPDSPTPAKLEGTILNLVQSPDGRKIAFELLGGDLLVADVDGSNRIALGRGHRPAWSPDSRWIVFMVTEEDGHRITGSELAVAGLDGRVDPLTHTAEIHEMNPSWSPTGDLVTYDFAGKIYALPVSIRTEGRE